MVFRKWFSEKSRPKNYETENETQKNIAFKFWIFIIQQKGKHTEKKENCKNMLKISIRRKNRREIKRKVEL